MDRGPGPRRGQGTSTAAPVTRPPRRSSRARFASASGYGRTSWSLLGAFAAYQHGIVHDYGLLAAGIVTAALVLLQRRGEPTQRAGAALYGR